VAYEDGGEARVLEAVHSAQDISSVSDELERQARTWPELYHLSKSRANCLRAFDLNREMRVLDVGGGCGAIARYLGEVCGQVDLLEPMPARAAVARERTRDLDNVEVFVGDADAVPPEPAYDLITVIGVLEYVGSGALAYEPYIEFLRKLARLLLPGGRILIGIENRLGVKYLAGAPEDHSGRLFDGVEGYRSGGPARTFSRIELEELLGSAGLAGSYYHAFPDYKLTRVVFSERIFEPGPQMALTWRVPSFPSPDWDLAREPWVDEEFLWQALVQSSNGRHFSNSFVAVVSPTGSPAEPIWRNDQLAAFYTTTRRARFATETRVLQDSSGTRFRRHLVAAEELEAHSGDVTLRVEDSEFVRGSPLLEMLAESGESGASTLLAQWRDLVGEVVGSGKASIDLIASNIIVDDNRRLCPIDQEWQRQTYGVDDVLARGVLWLAHHLAQLVPPERWQEETTGAIAVRLGRIVGLDEGGEWLTGAIDREAEFQALVHDCDPGDPGWPEAVESRRGQLQQLMDARLEDGRLGPVRRGASRLLRERLSATRAELEEKDRAIATIEAERDARVSQLSEALGQMEQALNDAGQQLEAIRASFGYRLLEKYRRGIRWLFPQGAWWGVPYRGARKLLKVVVRAPAHAASMGRRAGKARQRYGSIGMVTKSFDHLAARSGSAVDPVKYALSVDWENAERGIVPSRPLNREAPVINWVIPTFGEGGGLRTIFRIVEFLQSYGFRQRVYEMPVARPPRNSPGELRDLIRRFHGVDIAEVSLDFENMEPADITFATSWHTAYPVAKFTDTHLKCYFVQDFEPYFAPVGSESAVTENTYRMGFHGITAGRWLTDKLTSDYGMECDYFNLSVDTKAYFPKDMGARRKVFFYARPATPRRGFELGVAAIEVFHERNPGYEIVMAGGEVPAEAFSFPVTDVGYVSEDQLNDLYNQSAAALVISLTNCSLLPLEIMATGCPVVTTIGDNNDKILPPDSAILAVPSPHHLARALERAIKNPRSDHLIAAASQYKWEEQAEKVDAALRKLIDGVSPL
jgi:glycosyltransferase involved in cell wall biosynthesis/SAM-dependent methyltransferase